jgi:CubicO group peptidase (beta-lactamase class C family)
MRVILLLLVLQQLAGVTLFSQTNNNYMKTKPEKLQAILNKRVDGNKVFGTSFALKKDGFTWMGASGNMALDSAFFIASTTKLFTTAIVMHLVSKDLIALDASLENYLPNDIFEPIACLQRIRLLPTINAAPFVDAYFGFARLF